MRGGGDKERHDRDGGQPDQQEDRPSAALVEPPGVEHREESGGASNAAVGAGDHRGGAGGQVRPRQEIRADTILSLDRESAEVLN